MAYADYDFYSNVFLGVEINPSEFDRLSERASEIIDTLTYSKITEDMLKKESLANKIKKANCALAEQLLIMKNHYDTTGNGAIASIKAGEESVTYNKNNNNDNNSFLHIQKDIQKTAISIISKYLIGTSLLYMGVD